MSTPARTASFDVFDTCLVRLVGEPVSVFRLLEQELLAAGLWPAQRGSFAAAREHAEQRARGNTRTQEVLLADIYAELAHMHGLQHDEVKALQAAECRIETRLLKPVPAAVAAVHAARQRGERVAFISDTYFTHDLLQQWLTTHGLLAQRSGEDAGDRLAASSTYGLTKARGDLFVRLLGDWRLTPSQMHHLGDNPNADLASPQRLGIAAQRFMATQPTRYERAMEAHAGATGGLASVFAGTARHARLAEPAPRPGTAHTAGQSAIASQVGGPVLAAYVLWVLRRAQQLKLKRLLFVSRDGQALLRVARPLAAKLGLSIDMDYFYAGRQVVNLGGVRQIDAAALDWITESAANLSVDELLRRVDLGRQALAQAIEIHRLDAPELQGPARIDAIKRFVSDPQVSAAILASAAQRRALLRDYFSACGLMGDASVGLIDIGWKGRVYKAIAEVIGPQAASRHTSFYFGLYGRPNPVPAGRMEAFLFDASPEGRTGMGHWLPVLTSLMEIFCQGDHGQVLSIERHEAGFRPVLRTPGNDCGPRWDVPQFQADVEFFAQALPLDPDWALDSDLRGMCHQLLSLLLRQPDTDEASVLGAFPFNDDQGGAMAAPLASGYGLNDLKAAWQRGAWPENAMPWWPAGTERLTPPRTLFLIRLAARAGRLRQKMLSRQHAPKGSA